MEFVPEASYGKVWNLAIIIESTFQETKVVGMVGYCLFEILVLYKRM